MFLRMELYERIFSDSEPEAISKALTVRISDEVPAEILAIRRSQLKV